MTVMTAEPRTLRTKAEEGLIAEYRGGAASLPGGERVSSSATRRSRPSSETGLPHRRVEAWKYTDLRALMRTVVPLATDGAQG